MSTSGTSKTPTPKNRKPRQVDSGLDRFLALGQVMEITTLGKSAVYNGMADGEFPKSYRVAKGRVAWLQSEIHAWMQSKIAA